MAASFTVHNGLIDVTFAWPNVLLDRAQDVVFGAAHYLWSKGQGPTIEVDGEEVQKPWDDLSAQEKLTMTFAYTQRALIEMAKTSLVDVDTDAARAAALAYAEANYSLEA